MTTSSTPFTSINADGSLIERDISAEKNVGGLVLAMSLLSAEAGTAEYGPGDPVYTEEQEEALAGFFRGLGQLIREFHATPDHLIEVIDDMHHDVHYVFDADETAAPATNGGFDLGLEGLL